MTAKITFDELKFNVMELSSMQLEELSLLVINALETQQIIENSNNLEDAHLFNGIICPKCGSIHCVKNGLRHGRQRFLCRDCSKSFGTTTQSLIASSKLPKSTWIEYIKCMINGMSIRKSAEICEVSSVTSFYMRHKILDAINILMDKGSVGGIVEMDETFLAESFKGNHKKSGFDMPRKSRKRGKEVQKRGISSEQICIGTAIDKNGNIIMEMACKGRITSKKLEKLFDGHVAEDSTICTDSYSSYKTLSKKLKLKHKRIPSGQHADGLFNLSCVNSLHSRFKTWMRRFNGVSTKFLPNYLGWFKWLESTKNMKESARPEQMWTNALARQVDVRIDVLKQREPIWI